LTKVQGVTEESIMNILQSTSITGASVVRSTIKRDNFRLIIPKKTFDDLLLLSSIKPEESELIFPLTTKKRCNPRIRNSTRICGLIVLKIYRYLVNQCFWLVNSLGTLKKKQITSKEFIYVFILLITLDLLLSGCGPFLWNPTPDSFNHLLWNMTDLIFGSTYTQFDYNTPWPIDGVEKTFPKKRHILQCKPRKRNGDIKTADLELLATLNPLECYLTNRIPFTQLFWLNVKNTHRAWLNWLCGVGKGLVFWKPNESESHRLSDTKDLNEDDV
jgi:hypothetical protein